MLLVRLIRIISILQCKIRIGREVCRRLWADQCPNYGDGALGLQVTRESAMRLLRALSP